MHRHLQVDFPRWFVACSFLGIWLAANGGDSAIAAENATPATTYLVKGTFLESRSEGRVAVIAHEKIPGYMEPMTMPFNVKKPAELKGLKRGDQILFQLSVTDTDDWIDDIKKSKGHSNTIKSAEPPQSELNELKAGAPVPDCLLTNQAGEVIHLNGFKGQALALTFFFSRCPLPSFCPRMNHNFATVQQELAADTARTNWQLLSISFDPGFDTPQNLSNVAQLQKSDPRHWNFATSNREDLRQLGSAFGLKFWRENGTFSHNLRTVVVDASGRVQRIFNGNEWQPADVVAEMRKAMAVP
jgi:protein SCO1